MKRTEKEKHQDSEQTAAEAEDEKDRDREGTDRPGDTEDATLKTKCEDELDPHSDFSHLLPPLWEDDLSLPELPEDLSWLTDTTPPAEPGSHDRPVKRRSLVKAALEESHDSSGPKRQREEDTKHRAASTHQDFGFFTALDPVQPPLYPPYYTQTSGSLYLPPLPHIAPTMFHPIYLPYSHVKPTMSGVPDRMLLKGSVDEVVLTWGEEKKEVDRESRKEDLKLSEVRRNLVEDEARLSILHEEMEKARKELEQLNLRTAEISIRMEKVGWNPDQFDKEDNTSVVSPLGGLKVQSSPLSELWSSGSSESTETSCRSSADRHTESVKEEEAAGAPDEKMKRSPSDPKRQRKKHTKDRPASTHQDSGLFTALDPVLAPLYPSCYTQTSGSLYLSPLSYIAPTMVHPSKYLPYSHVKPTMSGVPDRMLLKGSVDEVVHTWGEEKKEVDRESRKEDLKLSEVRRNLVEDEARLSILHEEMEKARKELEQLNLRTAEISIRMEKVGWNPDQFDKEDNTSVVSPLGGLKVQSSPLSELWSSGSSESTETSCRSSADRHTESVKEEEAAGAPDEKMKRSPSDPKRQRKKHTKDRPASTHQDSGLFTALDPVLAPLYPSCYTQTSGSLYLSPLSYIAPTMVHPSHLPYSDVKPTMSGVPDRMLLKGSVDEVVHTWGEEKKEVDREETQTQFRQIKSRKEDFLLPEVRRNLMEDEARLSRLHEEMEMARKELELKLRTAEISTRMGKVGWNQDQFDKEEYTSVVSPLGGLKGQFSPMSELRSSISCSTPPPDSQTESVKVEQAGGAPDEKMKRSSESDSLHDEAPLDLSRPHWIQEECGPQSPGMNIMHDDDDDEDDVQTSAEEKKEVDRDREEAADPAQDTASEQPAEGALHSRDGPLMMSLHVSASSAQPPKSDPQSCSRPRSASWSSPSQPGSDRTLRRAASLSDMKSESSLEEFTPEFWEDGDDEVYSFHCSCPGLFRCSVTGLVFHMQGGGDVFYRLVPWDRSLLAPHHKKPAGPLFDIKCPQQCVSQLHLPHCEIRSTGGCGFLSVVHLKGDGVEFIPPHRVTDTHVIINITGFSAYGNVKDEDSPPDPVQALVLLFYRPPEDPDLTSFLSVLLLPRNIVLRDVLRTRMERDGKERFIETSSNCKLQPKQLYTLSTDPEDDLILVQPTEAEFDEDYDNNYIPVFQVILEKIFKPIKLLLKDSESSHSVWERRVYLQSTGVSRSSGSTGLRPHERLRDVRSSFIEKISAPVLSSLLDKLLEKKVLTDAERESAEEKPNRRDRAGSVIDTVRRKGEAASSELIHFLCEVDPFLCEHLGLS
ncbi:uncharacterized protein LOC114452827 [Parambassis ranga]|uniref:Uncharacterized protein LOC114452827 n=1 Tax=Parambassis ranga TaxID=210632 RepID=A0A6P7KII0_9TELE|nr:uncharacterized protein LOC114452827 [Parambassis ranga]